MNYLRFYRSKFGGVRHDTDLGTGWTTTDLWPTAEPMERGNGVKKEHIFHTQDVTSHNTAIFDPPQVHTRYLLNAWT